MRIKAAPVEQRNREMFFSQVSQHLPMLYRFVRHELAYREAVGDLLPDDLTPEDVVARCCYERTASSSKTRACESSGAG